MTISEKRTHFMKFLKYNIGKETTEISKDGLLTIKKNPWAGKSPRQNENPKNARNRSPNEKRFQIKNRKNTSLLM